MEFLSVILPIFSIFMLGFIGEKKIGFDTKTISKMTVYLMSPVLVFRTFYTTKFDEQYAYMALYMVMLCFALIFVVYVVSWIRGYATSETCAMILASVFMNNGNYGTPVLFLLFGATGFDYGIILMVIQSLVMCTIGVYYAAKGSPDADGFRSALRAVRRMPLVYGAMLGALFQALHIQLNESVQEAVNLVANATIPTIMLVLGMQLAKISIINLAKEKLSFSLSIKLAISPVIAYALTFLFPMDDIVKQILIIMAAMPTAANTTMYALQFDTEPEFVSSVTLISTLLSLVTLPIMFAIVL